MERSEILRWLGARLTQERYDHSLAVEKRAGFLAGIHGVDAEKAELAGLLHDCCHSLPPDRQLKIIESHGILLDEFTAAQPQLWHAIAGEIAVREELGIDDGEILTAIRLHTTGAGDMPRLAQVVYLADLTSADREYEGAEENRGLSEKSLELAMRKQLSYTIGYLVKTGAPVVKDAFEAYNYFWELTCKEQNG